MLTGHEIGVGEALTISITGIGMVMFELGLLAVIVVILTKIVAKIDNFKKTYSAGKEAGNKKAPVQVAPTPSKAPISSTEDEDEIAAIMVAVCEESGIPLEKIHFKEIREIK